MSKILVVVTGAAGFIGSHLCEALIKKGYRVIGLDNLSMGEEKNISDIIGNRNFSFQKIDITNEKINSPALKDAKVIVHLAALKIPRYGGRLKTLVSNTKGTENLLKIASKNKAKFIFISTSDVYGKNPKLPFSEESNLVLGSSEVARWAYAISKIFDEHLCFSYFEEYNLPFVILRLFGVYGPRQHRTWWGGPQGIFIDNILRGKTVEIHGNGAQTRTFVYIDDVITAITKSMTAEPAIGQIINIGSNQEIPIINLARKIAGLSKKPLKIRKIPYISFTGKKYEDVARRRPDINKAKKMLNWKPLITLETGLKNTIRWHLDNPI